MKKNKISKNWVNKQRRDTYVRQSKIEGYRARSAYKIKEIDEKFKIFKGGMSVVDIGAAPGSWSQYVAKVVRSGKIISVDLKLMENIDNRIMGRVQTVLGIYSRLMVVMSSLLTGYIIEHISIGSAVIFTCFHFLTALVGISLVGVIWSRSREYLSKVEA